MAKPTILRAGNDPKCVHRESVDSGLIGTCSTCGQVKSYRDATFHDGSAAWASLRRGRAAPGFTPREVTS